MPIEHRGQLTCYKCSRSTAISEEWLASAQKRLGRALEEWDVIHLRCTACGEKSPEYVPPVSIWNAPDYLKISVDASEQTDGLYGLWDTHDYGYRFDNDL